MTQRHALLVPLLALACATPDIHIPEGEQVRSQRELAGGPPRFLRVACWVGPLWDDTDKLFLSDRPAEEIDLVDTPRGKPIRPPPFERVLPPGTPVRIQRIEFPETFTMAQRVLVTPRFHAWVYLALEGEPRPVIVVLPREVKSAEDVRAELERYLAAEDPRPALAALPADVRERVLRKEAAPGMSARALEMAWGLPDRKRVDRPAGTEEWSWGSRRVLLRDDRVERVDRP
ncbi:MAG TPA: hypothetical protein VEB43_19475 [Anaeromyxobacter sp.]|nr:hypothetical protein [Anaeromyxobacter sp.]